MIKVRTRYLDDRLDEQLRQGFRQVVVLGSGFDTRSIRKQTAGVNYFEIDDPGTLNFKKARLEANNIRAGTNYISGDYVSDDLNTLLESGGFDFSLPAHFIWEGNTMYLTADSVRSSRTGRRPIYSGTTGRTVLSTRPFTAFIPCAHWRGRGRTSRNSLEVRNPPATWPGDCEACPKVIRHPGRLWTGQSRKSARHRRTPPSGGKPPWALTAAPRIGRSVSSARKP